MLISRSFPFRRGKSLNLMLVLAAMGLTSCADVRTPGTRDVNIPAPRNAEERKAGVNERPDAVTYLPLGSDVLVPEAEPGSPLPSMVVGPYELRSETLAGALQLILDGTNIPIAFETTEGLDRTITVANLHGTLDAVVDQVCGLADLYCSYRNGVLVVKETEVFTVAIPPIVAADQVSTLLSNIAGAVGSIVGTTPITDASTRTIVYRASQRTAEVAERYFQRLRMNTALVVYETYIWEVSLDAGNSTGIRWQNLDQLRRFNVGINLPGAADALLGTPISIGLPTTGSVNFTTGDVLQFISDYGAVKTVSQPQLTVLSGSSARLRVADTQNFVASISRTTTDGGNTTVSTTTDSVDSGFTLEIASNWDNSSVYSNISILLQEVRGIDTFDDNPDAVVQLPQTTERELTTQVRIRPGDSLLIAGLVRENDGFDKSGPGLNEPILPISRSATTSNSELVFLIKPRVIVFTSEDRSSPVPHASEHLADNTSSLNGTPVQTGAMVPEPVQTESMAAVEPTREAVLSAPVPDPSPTPPLDPAPESAVSMPVVRNEETASSAATSDPSVIVDYNVLGGGNQQ